jgi:hypothetical protein
LLDCHNWAVLRQCINHHWRNVHRNNRILWGGFAKQLIGLLLVGSLTAYLITAILPTTVPGATITNEILLRAMPNEKDFILAILTAVGAGAAASLVLSADPRIVAEPWGANH